MRTDLEAMHYPLVLDGGLSNVLESMGCDLGQRLWSAAMLLTDPDALVRAHLAYLRAGADIITTASYQASIAGFVEAGRSVAEAEALLRRSVELAERARARYRAECPDGADVLIAASIGPYGACLADGSEYTGVYEAGDEELRAFHEPRLRIIAGSGPDLLAFETLPCLREIAILADLLDGVTIPAWFSFCCRDASHLHDGASLSEAIALLKDLPVVFALGANCTAPEYIADVIRLVQEEAPDKRVVVYPNSGEAYDAATGGWRETGEHGDFRRMAAEWIALGADIVGGCCRIGPDHIRSIRRLVSATGGA
jgi:homocysteine S-methyltransferase